MLFEPAGIEVHAEGYARATPPQAWRVLTDYERLTEFVPHLQSSVLVSRNGTDAVLEQVGNGGFLLIQQQIHLLLRIREEPHSAIAIHLISGNMQSYDAHWQLSEEGGGTRIGYRARLQPDFFVPPVIGPALIQKNIERMMQAVLKEIERRAGL
jgi:carbon monoxide dehydrogenase subunit G